MTRTGLLLDGAVLRPMVCGVNLFWSRVCCLLFCVADFLHAAPEMEPLRILKKECFRCHTEAKRKGGLMMTSRAGLLEGGETGAALEPGNVEGGLLVKLLQTDADPHMPPKGQLAPAQVEALRTWIKGGAFWDQTVLTRPEPLVSVTLHATPENYRPVTALQVSPDGATLAVGRGARVELFNLRGKDLAPAGELPMQEVVQSLAWSPDGKALASGGFRRILIWDPAHAERLAVVTDHLEGRVTALCFAGDALVAADEVPGRSGNFRTWSARDWSWGTERIEAHGDTIYDLALSPDGKLLASASADREVKVWNALTLELENTLEGHTGYVLAVAFSPKGDKLASAGDDEQIKVWALDTWKQVNALNDRRPTRAITDLLWTTDDGIISTTEDGVPREWTKLVPHEGGESSAGATERNWETHSCALTQVVLAGERVVFGDEQGGIEVRDLRGKLLQTVP